jgi:hypothetical protein
MTLRRETVPLGVFTIAIALLAACSTSPADATSPIASADSSFGPTALDCPRLDLRGPNGEVLDLTGTWEGGATTHYVRQIGECVWWIALSHWPGQELGDFYSITFAGRLDTDFTLHGEFAAILRPHLGGVPISPGGRVTFAIDLSEEPIRMHQVAPIDPSAGGYVDATLRYVGPLPLPQPP